MTEKRNIEEQAMEALANAKLFLTRDYLQCISQARVLGTNGHDSAEAMRLIHIDSLLYDQKECISEKLKTLFSAVENYGESIVFLINGKRDRAEIYMGIVSEQSPTPVFNTFLRSLNSLLPGCHYKILHNAAIRSLMDDVLPPSESIHISSVAAFPSETKESGDALQKLDILIEGMKHTPFSMLLLAQSILPEELSSMQQYLQRIYTELSVLERSTETYSRSSSQSIGESISKAVTESIGYSASLSQGHGITRGEGVSEQQNGDKEQMRHRSGLQLAGTAAAMLLSGPGQNALQSLFYSSSLTNILSSGENLLGMNTSETQSVRSKSYHTDRNENESVQRGENRSQGQTEQKGYSTNSSGTYSETQQITKVEKSIVDILAMLDAQLKQIALFLREGAFYTAAYFIAGDSESVVSAANLYRSICTAGNLPILRTPLCEWSSTADVAIIRKYLQCGQHPIFRFPKNELFPQVRVAQLIGLSDMPRYFALPERTIPGIIASTSARFARDVVSNGSAEKQGETLLRIGCIYHMGKEDKQTTVHLRLNDLAKHLFVAGATGVGKSNFCYQLLDELDKNGVKMLIIEPAKGEYRQVLGGHEGFSVYGVDPSMGPMLHINPFACPDRVPTVQHIERLLDIFNTAWPMYSAMPAILKEAVELIYVEKGFNLMGSGRPMGAQFPSFCDLLEALPRVINQSSYSAEVKGNYIGALVTRVRSLTNGLYGLIFNADEIGDAKLFGENAIVDISRIGSAETKALLMGVLTMRLIECRMSEGKINAPLRHVTVLEEAHNLLRRYNPTSEGTSARASSVEMLATAIAEMRTSGEGFIIADQSPSVMDWSVIRNTQTKVFFMLPDREDRTIAANSLSLNEEQAQEIAMLRPGVAAVLQNGWMDAVLCKIDYFDKSREKPFLYAAHDIQVDYAGLGGQAIAVLLKPRLGEAKSSVSSEKVAQYLQYDTTLLGNEGKYAQDLLRQWQMKPNGFVSPDDRYRLLCQLLPVEQILHSCPQAQSINQWREAAEGNIAHRVTLNQEEIRALISWGLYRWSKRDSSAKGLYLRYLEAADTERRG